VYSSIRSTREAADLDAAHLALHAARIQGEFVVDAIYIVVIPVRLANLHKVETPLVVAHW
jgi:outer membrane PBP1 activator LpoA protein